MLLSFADVLVMLGSGIDATCFVQLLVVSFFSITRINQLCSFICSQAFDHNMEKFDLLLNVITTN